MKPRIVILGILGRSPFAGVAWQVMHYLEAFRRLGCDVYYVEDTGDWPYDAEQNTVTDDCSFPVGYIAKHLEQLGLSDRWAYRSGVDGSYYGLSEARVAELFASADALVNLTGATILREEHLRVPTRIYLETDPVMPQIEIAQGKEFTLELLGAHTHHFSYGENFGAPDCLVPMGQFEYLPTRQPIILDWWHDDRIGSSPSPNGRFTTIASWQQAGKDIEWDGETYAWSKHHEFLKFIDLPLRTTAQFELALACGDQDALELLASNRWRVRDALSLSRSIVPYRDFIRASQGEFTVAKDQNIRMRSGWFSDRSACYLASGRPVITQDTGFGNILPTGRGLFAFRTMEEIRTALEAIASDYEGSRRAALEIAEAYFDACKVVGKMLEQAGL